jgi:hypothetical protein
MFSGCELILAKRRAARSSPPLSKAWLPLLPAGGIRQGKGPIAARRQRGEVVNLLLVRPLPVL